MLDKLRHDGTFVSSGFKFLSMQQLWESPELAVVTFLDLIKVQLIGVR